MCKVGEGRVCELANSSAAPDKGVTLDYWLEKNLREDINRAIAWWGVGVQCLPSKVDCSPTPQKKFTPGIAWKRRSISPH